MEKKPTEVKKVETIQQEDGQPTPAQIKAYRDNKMKWYAEQIPFIRKMAEYERLMAEISESKIRDVLARQRYAEFMAAQPTAVELQKMTDDKRTEELKKEAELSTGGPEMSIVKDTSLVKEDTSPVPVVGELK